MDEGFPGPNQQLACCVIKSVQVIKTSRSICSKARSKESCSHRGILKITWFRRISLAKPVHIYSQVIEKNCNLTICCFPESLIIYDAECGTFVEWTEQGVSWFIYKPGQAEDSYLRSGQFWSHWTSGEDKGRLPCWHQKPHAAKTLGFPSSRMLLLMDSYWLS